MLYIRYNTWSHEVDESFILPNPLSSLSSPLLCLGSKVQELSHIKNDSHITSREDIHPCSHIDTQHTTTKAQGTQIQEAALTPKGFGLLAEHNSDET